MTKLKFARKIIAVSKPKMFCLFQNCQSEHSCSAAARRQTAANFACYFQMAALCRDAATPIPAREFLSGWRTIVIVAAINDAGVGRERRF
jgi:hypothetical protein